ncbi:hypothetical protein [Actinophytocola sediminis]
MRKTLIDTLESLAIALVKTSGQPFKTDDEVKAINVLPRAPKGYVWPRLTGWEENPDARVVIIEAAGAVGKSAAALALAERLKWPLVDTAKAQVGSYSLTGLIHDAFGFDSPFLAEVSTGAAGIIIDALDEAHLRAGTTNFEAFLDNVRKLAASPQGRRSPNVVLFSRPDTANLIKTYFGEHGTAFMSMTIEFFTYQQTCAYIASYLDVQHELHPGSGRFYDVARRHPEPFGALRDKRIREVASALTSSVVSNPSDRWGELGSFLGYAPVLAVLAEYLAVSNPKKEQGDDRSFRATPAKVLLEIIENILTREQKKFTDQVVPQLRAKLPADDDWDRFALMYTPEEQGIRLVARNLNIGFAAPVPADVPSSIRSEYDAFADQQIADHPFLADRKAVNVVFADYIRAKATIDVSCRTVLDREPAAEVTSVGPFFYQFVHEFSPKETDGSAELSEGFVAKILESYNQAFTVGGTPLSMYFQQDGSAQLFLIVIGSNLRDYRVILDFDIVDLSGFLEIKNELRRTFIRTDSALGLSGERDRFTIGPRVSIHCNELIVDIDGLSVDPIGGVNSIVAGAIEVRKNLTIDCPRPNSLQIVGRHPVSALIPYFVDSPDVEDYVDAGGYLTLRSLLRRFAQGIGSMPSVFADLLDHRVIKDNSERKRYMSRLCEIGVVEKASNHYYLNTSVLSGYGISFQDIINGSPTESILRFLSVLNDNQVG